MTVGALTEPPAAVAYLDWSHAQVLEEGALRVHPRRLPAAAAAAARERVLGPPIAFRRSVQVGEASEAVNAGLIALDSNSHADRGDVNRAALAADMVWLVESAQALAQGGSVQLRVEVIHNHGCQLFHVDRLCWRVCCTYAGMASQWLPDAAVDRAQMGRASNAHVLDWGRLENLETGVAAMLQGACGAPGLVHRSPPPGPAGPRLLVCVDVA